ATVRVNGVVLTEVNSRYRGVTVDLDGTLNLEGDNLLEVELDDSAQPNSRWYTGSGLYRPVWIDETGPARLAEDGLQIVTRSIDGGGNALLEIDTAVDGGRDVSASMRVEIRDGQNVVAVQEGPVGRFNFTVSGARLWSADEPHLYDIAF